MLYQTPQTKRCHNQEGVAIVVALFIVALVATMAYVMMARLARDTDRTQLLLRDIQAEYYAKGSLAWAMDVLANDWKQQKPNQPVDSMPITSPVKEVNGYQIKSTIYDMQDRFNLNNLKDAEALDDFKRLLQILAPSLSMQQTEKIAKAIADWITDRPKRTETNQYYLERSPPYRAAGQPMLSISELRLVNGMSEPLYTALEPYVIALPYPTKINVITAKTPVLVTLSKAMTVDAAKTIVEWRAHTNIASPATFLNFDVVKNHPVLAEKITVLSNYFLAQTEVSIEEQHLVLYTLLERTTTQSGTALVNIVWQSKGVW